MMAFTVKGVVDGLESFTGKRIAGTSQPNITLDDFKDIIEDALELGIVRANDMKLRRTGTQSRTKEHTGYEPIQHVALEQTPFEVVTEGLEFTVDDVI